MNGKTIPELPMAIFRAIIVAVLGVAAPGAMATVVPTAVGQTRVVVLSRAATLKLASSPVAGQTEEVQSSNLNSSPSCFGLISVLRPFNTF